jgi:hypothetical protein
LLGIDLPAGPESKEKGSKNILPIPIEEEDIPDDALFLDKALKMLRKKKVN